MRRCPKIPLSGVLSHITSPPLTPPCQPLQGKVKRLQVSSQTLPIPVLKPHLCAVAFLFVLVSSCFAFPKIEAPKGDKPGSISFRLQDCRPLSEEQLQKRMGRRFDSLQMASLRLSQRSGGGMDEGDLEGFQGDDASVYSEDVFYEEEEEEDEQDIEEEEEEVDSVQSQQEPIDKAGRNVYRYMRRKRGVNERDNMERRANSRAAKRGRGSNSFNALHLKLALEKNRKQLKKELRAKIRKTDKDPPWECKMETYRKYLPNGTFPRSIPMGRCVTDKCFFNIYNCSPKKYRIRLLERDPDRCNPLPLYGTNTTYEEKWYFKNFFVTVACNCERRKPKRRRWH